jgi:anti-sigma regulatory factor (Ser/Thr protein kinase)
MGTRISEKISELTLDASPESPRLARRFIADTLGTLGQPCSVEDAQVITSELVTNAVAETQKVQPDAPITAHVGLHFGKPVVEVWDCSTTPPVANGDDLFATNGRGLIITQALSADWGYEIVSAGKVVWAVFK